MTNEHDPQIARNGINSKDTKKSTKPKKKRQKSALGENSEEISAKKNENQGDNISIEADMGDSDIKIMDMSAEVDKYADIDFNDDEQLKSMLKDFSDVEDLSMEEMIEIQSAIDDVKGIPEDKIEPEDFTLVETVEPSFDQYEGWGLYEEIKPEFKPEISEDLESLIQEELERKRKKTKIITEEEFKQYCLQRKSRIWYHALWTLVFDIEDHEASKDILYELLKELTSKSPIDPIDEHKFYFGLGFILRLSLNGTKVIEFRGEKLKLNVGIDILNDILHEVGPPVSERPIISDSEKKKMFKNFLTDDFSDI